LEFCASPSHGWNPDGYIRFLGEHTAGKYAATADKTPQETIRETLNVVALRDRRPAAVRATTEEGGDMP
jgi:hypothetical protein